MVKKLEDFLKKYKPKEVISDNLNNLLENFETFNKPCVLKIVGELHKTEKKGVILNIKDKEDLKKAYDQLSKISKELLLQEQVEGVELFVGSKKDEVFGKIILFGIGGIYTELYNDISIRKIPLTKEDIDSMILDLKGKKLFFGFRNIKINKDKLYSFLVDLSKVLLEDEFSSIDLNPVILNEKDIYCVDIKVIK